MNLISYYASGFCNRNEIENTPSRCPENAPTAASFHVTKTSQWCLLDTNAFNNQMDGFASKNNLTGREKS